MGSVPQRDYESPFPECKVTATVDEYAFIRLDMKRARAVEWVEEVQQAVDQHDSDGLVTLGVTMPEQTYTVFARQVAQLVEVSQQVTVDGPKDLISTQVVLDRDLEPEGAGVSVAVIINESQLMDVFQNTGAALAASDGDVHRWEFSVSIAGAQMLVQQLIAACNGADNPLDHVDLEEVDHAE